MNNWNVKLLEKVGPVVFGMERNQLRAAVGLEYTEFKKGKFSRNTAR